MKRNTFEMYWSYYLSIEEMFRRTSQYISHTEDNQHAYSDEFTKIILLSCSEVDSLLKLLCSCKGVSKKGKYYNMSMYADVLQNTKDIKEYAYCTQSSTVSHGVIVFPFKEICTTKQYGGLSWWSDYQSLKHNRLLNAKKGNLFNATSAVVAQYLILRFLIDFLDEYSGKEYVKEHNCSKFWIPVV